MWTFEAMYINVVTGGVRYKPIRVDGQIDDSEKDIWAAAAREAYDAIEEYEELDSVKFISVV